MSRLKELLGLSTEGYTDLKKGIFACTLTNFSNMLGIIITMQIIIQLFKPFTGENINWMVMWILFMLGIVAGIIMYICSRNDYRKTYVACYSAAQESRMKIVETVRKLPMSVFDSKDLTELTTNMMNDCEAVEHAMSHVVPPLIANAISATVVCIVLAFFDWRMALSVFCTMPIAFLIMLASRKAQEQLNKRLIESKLKASQETQDYLDGMKIIKACHLDGEKFDSLKKAINDLKNQSMKVETGTGVLLFSAQFILQSGIGIAIFVGTHLLTKGTIALLPLLLSLVISTRIYGPIISILTILPMMFNMLSATKRLSELMQIPIMEGSNNTIIPSYDISLDNIAFKYKDKNVIDGISAKIKQGSITALVGPSGSGKTTLTKLIARFWDVNEGKITIGEVDIKTLDPEYLMSKMSFVFQDVILFSDTVMNNIRVGNLSASDKEVYAAAKAAQCDEFIERLPHGYQTMLNENGKNLSGGERQRISIARALLKNAPVVLLDEATASLDSESEVYVQKAISKLIQGKTVILIAHRLRTIVGADQILVIQDGKLVEQGRHEDLLLNEGLYKRMYNLQNESLNWSAVN